MAEKSYKPKFSKIDETSKPKTSSGGTTHFIMNKLIKTKKGFANAVTQSIVAIGVGVVVIAVIAIMLGAFRSDLVTNTAGCNATVTSACGYAYNVTTQGLTFLDNATDKFDTAGTIVGVLVLLAVLGGAGFGGYMLYQKSRS